MNRTVVFCTAVLWSQVFMGGWIPLGAQPFGLTNRVAATTLNVPPTPPQPPATGLIVTNAFGNLTVLNPVVITTPPGETNRLFFVEQDGRIMVITNLAAPNLTVFLNIITRVTGGVPQDERGLLGMAFHPGYESNRYFYVYYSTTITSPSGSGLHQRVSRFETSEANPNAALDNSEQPLLTMIDQANNHNGGDMHFGPDEYLYISTGDEGGGNDEYDNSQIIDKDFWAGILRLDVDRRVGNLPPNPHLAIHAGTYFVPLDNPFVGRTTWHGSNVVATAVRTEFYAVGLRNPWRMSFDPVTERLYCGDVGQGAREEVDVIVMGGNYGWAFREGFIAGPKPAPAGVTRIDPILDYPRGNGVEQGFSVTGGVVYRGQRFPELYGHYIFADYVSGNIWSTFYDGVSATPKQRITGKTGIAGFGVDPRNGDVLLADQGGDTILRLTTPFGGDYPETLEETGIFADLDTLEPNPGIIPYDVNVPIWADGAQSRHWFTVANTNLVITFRPTLPWTMPTGTVWVQHFDLELTNGVPESRRKIETRLLVRGIDSTSVYGVSYRWDEAQTNAHLVPDGGSEETFELEDEGGLRTLTWQYPSRASCLSCHSINAGLYLGFTTPQMNRDFDYGGVVDNQLRSLEHAGYFSSFSPVRNRNVLRNMAHPTNDLFSVEYRVRSYLSANCAHCHRAGGLGLGNFFLEITRTLPNTGMIHGELINDLGDPENRVVVPGSLEHSAMWLRIISPGGGRMPPFGSTTLDPAIETLFAQWVTNELVGYQTLEEWQTFHFGSPSDPDAGLGEDPDEDTYRNNLEYLVRTDPTDPAEGWTPVGIERDGDRVVVSYDRVANRGFEVQHSTAPTNGPGWNPLDVPENKPVFALEPSRVEVPDSVTNGPTRFYRVRVFEP